MDIANISSRRFGSIYVGLMPVAFLSELQSALQYFVNDLRTPYDL